MSLVVFANYLHLEYTAARSIFDSIMAVVPARFPATSYAPRVIKPRESPYGPSGALVCPEWVRYM